MRPGQVLKKRHDTCDTGLLIAKPVQSFEEKVDAQGAG